MYHFDSVGIISVLLCQTTSTSIQYVHYWQKAVSQSYFILLVSIILLYSSAYLAGSQPNLGTPNIRTLEIASVWLILPLFSITHATAIDLSPFHGCRRYQCCIHSSNFNRPKLQECIKLIPTFLSYFLALLWLRYIFYEEIYGSDLLWMFSKESYPK